MSKFSLRRKMHDEGNNIEHFPMSIIHMFLKRFPPLKFRVNYKSSMYKSCIIALYKYTLY